MRAFTRSPCRFRFEHINYWTSSLPPCRCAGWAGRDAQICTPHSLMAPLHFISGILIFHINAQITTTITHTHTRPPKHSPVTYPHGRAVDFDVQPILQVIARQGHNGLPPGVIPSQYHLRRGQAGLCGVEGGRVFRQDEGLRIGGCCSARAPPTLAPSSTPPYLGQEEGAGYRQGGHGRDCGYEKGGTWARRGCECRAVPRVMLQPSPITNLPKAGIFIVKWTAGSARGQQAGPVCMEDKERGCA